MGDQHPVDAEPREVVFSFAEVADQLNVPADTLQRLSQRFSQYLGQRVSDDEPLFTHADVATLVAVQKLVAQGYSDEQIHKYLAAPTQIEVDNLASTSLASTQPEYPVGDANPQTVGEILNTIVSSQEAVLNSQATIRDMIGVIVHDNFNLKDENRKLRERMLEMERALAEYQRREETRKERMENRLRALEGTVGALQQQVAQLVQLYRQQRKPRRGWFW